MPKTRILLASILKPINDTRMFEKLGCSLAKLPGTEIHLIGQASTLLKTENNIALHPVFSFRRLSFYRLAAQWKYYKILHKVKPHIIIVTSPELLPVTILFKILFKAEILYDVQENYFSNITNQSVYPGWLKPVLGKGIRLLEKLSGRFISHYFLAERSYTDELTFLGENYTVLENKYSKPSQSTSKTFPIRLDLTKQINLLYSGTITEIYGIWEAINLAEKLYKHNSNIGLTIIGYCGQANILKEIRENIKDKPFIALIGGSALVPHSEIIKTIRTADIGLLSYKPNPSTENCIPTKLFEYQAEGLPMLIPQNKLWEEVILKANAGFRIDYLNPDPEEILNQLEKRTFYVGGIPEDVFWDTEEEKLLNLMREKLLFN